MKLLFSFAASPLLLLLMAASTTATYIRPETSSERVIIPFPNQPVVVEPRVNCPHLDLTDLLDWHDPTTWPSGSVPGAGTYNDVITVPENTRVLISQSMPTIVHGKVIIPATSQVVIGESVLDDEIEIHAHGIEVVGGLIAGSESCEIRDTKIRIVLHGTRPTDIMTNPQEPAYKGIAVTGELSLHGKRYYNTWTRLSATASPGDTSLLLQHNVNWESGQEILLVTTAIKDSREWHQNEIFTIDSVEANPLEQGGFGTKVNITALVNFTHLANFAYQAEVGLLTRMIVIEGYDGDSEPTDPDDLLCVLKDNSTNYGVPGAPCTEKSLTGFGAHVIVMHTGIGQVQGVELHRVGQTNVGGRYPMHFHLLGDCPQCYFKASSVHRSYYRCATIHGTNKATVTENVFYDAIGSCLYMEDGIEILNTISYNLGAHIHMIGPEPATGGNQYIPVISQSDKLLVPSDVAAVVFYITNVHNNVIGNAASGGWGGFGFPILYDCLGPSQGCGFRPANVLPLTIDGNSAHSTGWWWYHTGGFYLSGSVYYDTDGTTMLYNAGRNSGNGKRDTCAENQCLTGRCGRACPALLQRSLTISNSKTFLIPGVGANSWFGGVEWLGYESHDNGMAIEALSRGFWVDNMLVNCRTGDKIEFPPGGKAFKMKGNGFFWYATGQLHIITNSHFRRCGYRGGGDLPDFDQYDTASDRGCGDDAETGCRDDSTTFGFPVHNDIDTAEVMQGTSAISFENCGRRFFLRDRRYVYADYAQSTMSARASNWIDADGSAAGLNEPVFMGSGKSDAGLWWKVDDTAVFDEQGPLWFIKKNDGPDRGLGHMKLSFDPVMHAAAGNTICTNPGVPNNPCPYLGKIRHLGQKYENDDGLPITANPDVVGLVGGYSWLLSFNEGSPVELLIREIEVYPDTPMMLSIPYPPAIPVTITAHAKQCKTSKKYTCTEIFHEVSSIDAVRQSEGNAYYRDATSNLLTIRVIMFSRKYTGNPTWIKPDFDTPGKRGIGLALDSFTRANITIPKKNAHAWISIVADCAASTTNAAYCAAMPDNTVNPDVCPLGYNQTSYDTCCTDQLQCVDASNNSPIRKYLR